MKVQFTHPLEGPRLIILVPQLACHSPVYFWLQSGLCAFDHCVEAFSGLEAIKEADEASVKSLKCLVPVLLETKVNTTDAWARLNA